MDQRTFLSQARVIVVAGKGGVGKTTVTAALGRLAADSGLSALVVSLDESGDLPGLFDKPPLSYEETPLYEPRGGGRLSGRLVTPDEALVEYLMEHGLGRLARRLASSGVLDVVSTAIPGIREILVLGKLKQLERAGAADLVVLDAPATGHAVRFLTSARGLLDAARSGPLRTQAEEVLEMLHDPARCQVLLVTLPEETPINELIETAYRFEDEVGVMLGPVLVNFCYEVLEGLEADPVSLAASAGEELSSNEVAQLAGAAAFRLSRQQLQESELGRLGRELPLPMLRLPAISSSALRPADLAVLSERLGRGVEALDERRLAAVRESR